MAESRKEREFRLREEDILSCALELFEAEGIDNVTVAQIAKQTDIGKGTVYKHFASKDDIFARIAYEFNQSMLHICIEETKEGSCEQKMRRMFEICFNKHVEFPLKGEIAVLCEHPNFMENLSPDLQQKCLAQKEQYFELLSSYVQQGVEEGVLDNVPLEELLCGAHAIFAGALQMLRDRSYTVFDHTEQLSEERFIQLIVQFTMAGMFGQKKEMI